MLQLLALSLEINQFSQYDPSVQIASSDFCAFRAYRNDFWGDFVFLRLDFGFYSYLSSQILLLFNAAAYQVRYWWITKLIVSEAMCSCADSPLIMWPSDGIVIIVDAFYIARVSCGSCSWELSEYDFDYDEWHFLSTWSNCRKMEHHTNDQCYQKFHCNHYSVFSNV